MSIFSSKSERVLEHLVQATQAKRVESALPQWPPALELGTKPKNLTELSHVLDVLRQITSDLTGAQAKAQKGLPYLPGLDSLPITLKELFNYQLTQGQRPGYIFCAIDGAPLSLSEPDKGLAQRILDDYNKAHSTYSLEAHSKYSLALPTPKPMVPARFEPKINKYVTKLGLPEEIKDAALIILHFWQGKGGEVYEKSVAGAFYVASRLQRHYRTQGDFGHVGHLSEAVVRDGASQIIEKLGIKETSRESGHPAYAWYDMPFISQLGWQPRSY